LTKLLSSDGEVEIRKRIAIWLFDILLLALGLVLTMVGKAIASRDILRRLSQTYPRALAGSIGLVLTVVMVVCTEGIFYGLNHYHKETVVHDVSWMRLPPPAGA
jgi:hypothetical protein